MNIKGTFKLNGAVFTLLSVLFCGTMTVVSSDHNLRTNPNSVELGTAGVTVSLIVDLNPNSSPDAVPLGTAGDFVILTKTGVTTTGVTSVDGDMGVSPIEATAITGFDLIMDSSNTFSTSSLVTGKVYAASYASPTPSKMTTAISDMETAFTNAAGRTDPNYTELYTGDLTGKTLNPGLYKWSTSVGFTGEVTFHGSDTDIWILQIAQDLTVGTGAKVILEGFALPQNIFWQVSGQTTISSSAEVQGIVLGKTAIVFGAHSKLTGRALAQTAVTMISTTITMDSQDFIL